MPCGVRARRVRQLGRGPRGATGLPPLPRERGARSGRVGEEDAGMPDQDPRRARRRTWLLAVAAFAAVAGVTGLLLALLTNIFERKQEARQPFVRVVEVTEDTMDPAVWGQNWSFQWDSYLKTSLPTRTKYGGRGLGASDAGPAEQKLDRDPWLRRIFAGYAFSVRF